MLTPEREQNIRDRADVMRAYAPDSFARKDGAMVLDLLAEIDDLRAEVEALREDSQQWWRVVVVLGDFWFSQESMTAADAVRKLLAENEALRDIGHALSELAGVSFDGDPWYADQAGLDGNAILARWREVAGSG